MKLSSFVSTLALVFCSSSIACNAEVAAPGPASDPTGSTRTPTAENHGSGSGTAVDHSGTGVTGSASVGSGTGEPVGSSAGTGNAECCPAPWSLEGNACCPPAGEGAPCKIVSSDCIGVGGSGSGTGEPSDGGVKIDAGAACCPAAWTFSSGGECCPPAGEGAPCFFTSATCSGETCGTTSCAAGETCCTGEPFSQPTCVEGQECPL